jgi:pimeloyl-ACP methyl ester carboxylesterase
VFRFLKTLGLSTLAVASVLALAAPAVAQTTGVKNVVLVHGAFADGSSWAKVIPLLQARGLNVVAVQNPLTSFADDVTATKRALALIDGPVLLVGHSYAGAVISEVGVDPKVAGLLFVAAGAPDPGQSFADMAAAAPTPPGFAEIKADSGGFLKLTLRGMTDFFAADVPHDESVIMAATQGPTNSACFGAKITNAAWQTKPSWYIVASNDQMIQPDLERALAKKIHATTITLATSHVPMVSQPDKVADFIASAAASVHVP